VLLAGGAAAASLASYVLHGIPLAVAVVLVRKYVNDTWNPHEPPGASRLNWRGYAQAGALWPIYSLALVCAVLHIRIPHIATPKERVTRAHPWLVAPQTALVAVLLAAIAWRLGHGMGAGDVVTVLFALVLVVAQLPTIHGALRP